MNAFLLGPFVCLDVLFICMSVCVSVCMSVPRFIQFGLGSCTAVQINALSMSRKRTSKGTTCKSNRYDSVQNIDFIHVYVGEAGNSMQYRSTNATLDSCCQIVYIVTYRWSHLSDIVDHSVEWCASEFLSTVAFIQVRYCAMQINVLPI